LWARKSEIFLILRVVGEFGVETLPQARLTVPAEVGKDWCFLRWICRFLEALDAALTVEADVAGSAESSSVAEWVRATSEFTPSCVAMAAMSARRIG
jgi:hypothetical protein